MKEMMKKTFALLLCAVMVLGCLPMGVFAASDWEGDIDVVEPFQIPTATVTALEKEDLTFALNFKADAATDAQLENYGDWYADFILTVNKDVTYNANGGADGYLSGQYDAWSKNWVNAPLKDTTISANTALNIMAYAAEANGEPGLRYTYREVYEIVKEFNCGIFFESEFLQANPDLKVTLELRMYNPVNERESYTIGDTYVFTLPEAPSMPTATVSEIENEKMTFAMNFKADPAVANQLSYYGHWYADFVLSVNKDVTFNANGGADGYLSGQYDAWSSNWVNAPIKDCTLAANTDVRIMEFAAGLMGEPGLQYTYREVYETVKDFDCGIFFEEAFLEANPDLVVTLELRMYNPANESENYLIGETYVFTIPQKIESVAQNVQTEKIYSDLNDALNEAAAGETVILLKNVEGYKSVVVFEDTTFDLNGYSLTANYYSCFGDTVDNSEANTGLLNAAHALMVPDNAHLPVKTENGYMFFEIIKFNLAYLQDGAECVFQPLFEPAAHEYLLSGKENTGVKVMVDISWNTELGKRAQVFEFSDEHVNTVIKSYKPSTGKYSQMYSLVLANGDQFAELVFDVYVISETGVQFHA